LGMPPAKRPPREGGPPPPPLPIPFTRGELLALLFPVSRPLLSPPGFTFPVTHNIHRPISYGFIFNRVLVLKTNTKANLAMVGVFL